MVSTLLPEILALQSGQDPHDVADPRVDVADEACAAVEAAELRRTLGGLPSRERDVLSSRFGIGQKPRSHRAIASELDLSVGTVWNIEQRALTMLRSAYSDPIAFAERTT